MLPTLGGMLHNIIDQQLSHKQKNEQIYRRNTSSKILLASTLTPWAEPSMGEQGNNDVDNYY